MVLVPIATAINLQEIDRSKIVIEHIDGDRGRDFSRILSNGDFNEDDICFFNEEINPNSVIYNSNEGEYEVEIHSFDFNNLYSINSYWQCGSCPHLFVINKHGKQKYVRELLKSASFIQGFDTITVPDEIFEIVIRELEDETTYIERIHINGRLYCENVVLRKGESLSIIVSPNDKLIIRGHYEPHLFADSTLNDIWQRNEIIKQ